MKEGREQQQPPPSRTHAALCAVQVKVWLGPNRDHYYVLSRFLVSRSLTITKIPSTKVGSSHGAAHSSSGSLVTRTMLNE